MVLRPPLIHLINFTKMVAAGNDFAVVDNTTGNLRLSDAALARLAKDICDRRYGAGADGMLLLEQAAGVDVRMRIFNPDGTEPDMCGNGARCCARYFSHNISAVSRQPIRIQTKAGIIEASVTGDMVKIGMSQPHSIKLNIKLPLNKSEFVAHSINTGVPHVVVFVKDLQGTDVTSLGNKIRNHREFSPQGTNADFVRVVGKDNIAVRTYERGVEAETLACGTGCVASALIYVLETCANKPAAGLRQIDVATRSGEVLKVFFDINGKEFSNVSLEGNAKIVYKGSFVPRPKTPAR